MDAETASAETRADRSTAGQRVARAGRRLVDLVMPPVCVACQARLADAQTLCGPCWRSIRFIQPPLCDRLGIPLPYSSGAMTQSARALADPPDYDRARAVGLYTGALSRLVVQFKYSDRLDAQHVLSRLMYGAGRELLADADVIMPVPLHWRRLASRTYNQSAVLAQRIGTLARVPVIVDGLIRHKRTRQQVELTGAQRLQNPRGAFRLNAGRSSRIAGAKIVLIDDVITTGSTINACARVLRKAGAVRIDVLAAALVDDVVDTMLDGTLPAATTDQP